MIENLSTPPPENDAVLVSRILAGERTLFERLVRSYNQRALTIVINTCSEGA